LGDDTFLVWTEDHYNQSRTTKAQLGREVAQRVIEDRVLLERNRNGVEIDPITFGIGEDQVARIKETLLDKVVIRNQSPYAIQVKVNDTFARKRNFKMDDPKTFNVPSEHACHVPIRFTPTTVGVVRTLITFDISSGNMEQFSIARYITVRSGNPEDYEMLKPKSPYEKKVFIERDGFNNRVDVEPGSIQRSSNKFTVPLKPYGIPGYWRTMLKSKDEVDDFITELYKIPLDVERETITDYSPFLTSNSYAPIFHRLLWTEEAQMEIDIKNYDMINNTSMTRTGRHWSLYVPGLAECRPSVLKGDTIIVRFNGDKNESYQGIVDGVEMEHALIQFPGKFTAKYVNGVGIDVRFTFKRMNLKTAHQALDDPLTRQILNATFRHQDVSFSTQCVPIELRRNLVLYNRDLNQEQRAAVTGVLASVARPSPYLIYGPPGTGKTVTVVESILQTLRFYGSSAKVLVSAPSNAAADLLCERLAPYMSAVNLARIIAYSREKSTVSDVVMKFTHYDNAEGAFICPPVEELKRKSVVIMTISSSGKNPNIGLNDHFTHVFVDEAGHITEPEVAGCFGAAKTSAVIVLAGDPKQLGPIIRSEKAKSLGLEISLLERLSKCGPYERQNGTYDDRVCTKLVKNYRSHPSILKVPNEMFYNNDLVASADVFRTHTYQSWEHLPTEGFPIIFHGVEGEDRREGNSPSWFNSEEATIVKHYVELLVKGTRTNRCKPEEIGIVTPYHKQVQKIRQLMKAKNYDTKVGSVDEFQGSERRVIIISTVRSSVDHIQFDKKHRLGFVANEKRFNVAITRAQALLIVIGNPFVLQNDKNWYELIKFCKENGGYTGCGFELGKKDEFDAETDNALKGIASMKLDDDSCSEDDDSYVNVEPISAMTALEQPEWRIEE
jgi:helicase MOV-10